jgi:hypothetical protein
MICLLQLEKYSARSLEDHDTSTHPNVAIHIDWPLSAILLLERTNGWNRDSTYDRHRSTAAKTSEHIIIIHNNLDSVLLDIRSAISLTTDSPSCPVIGPLNFELRSLLSATELVTLLHR